MADDLNPWVCGPNAANSFHLDIADLRASIGETTRPLDMRRFGREVARSSWDDFGVAPPVWAVGMSTENVDGVLMVSDGSGTVVATVPLWRLYVPDWSMVQARLEELAGDGFGDAQAALATLRDCPGETLAPPDQDVLVVRPIFVHRRVGVAEWPEDVADRDYTNDS